MAIYNIFQEECEVIPENRVAKDQMFSSSLARLFFFILFLLDIVWGIYGLCLFVVTSVLSILTGFKIKRLQSKAYLRVKRSLICGLALFVSIFSPALGVMFACTYFLMYDKEGIHEVVPSFLRAQFDEFLSQ